MSMPALSFEGTHEFVINISSMPETGLARERMNDIKNMSDIEDQASKWSSEFNNMTIEDETTRNLVSMSDLSVSDLDAMSRGADSRAIELRKARSTFHGSLTQFRTDLQSAGSSDEAIRWLKDKRKESETVSHAKIQFLEGAAELLEEVRDARKIAGAETAADASEQAGENEA